VKPRAVAPKDRTRRSTARVSPSRAAKADAANATATRGRSQSLGRRASVPTSASATGIRAGHPSNRSGVQNCGTPAKPTPGTRHPYGHQRRASIREPGIHTGISDGHPSGNPASIRASATGIHPGTRHPYGHQRRASEHTDVHTSQERLPDIREATLPLHYSVSFINPTAGVHGTSCGSRSTVDADRPRHRRGRAMASSASTRSQNSRSARATSQVRPPRLLREYSRSAI
jgi:hypothetical protein